MKLALPTKIKPKQGYSHVVHLLLTAALPVVIYVLVRANFILLAVLILLISKWRMFAVRPRYWIANIRGNAVDYFVGISIIYFMAYSFSHTAQLVWTTLYAGWLLFIKPRSSMHWVSLQAFIGQTMGLFGVYLVLDDSPIAIIMVAQWLICYYAARHFFTSFEETHARFLSMMWAYFAAGLGWILSHWLLYYFVLSQPTLLLSVLSFGLGGLYYLDHHDRLSVFARRQFVFVMSAIVIIVLLFSNWADAI